MNIKNLLKGKKSKEKAQIKSREIAKCKIGKYTKGDFDIEIIGDITEIEGGIQLFAKAWKDGKQLGFGKDGTVEIERFLIYNPPILVDDENGEIVRKSKNEKGETIIRLLREDPMEALKQSLTHTIGLVGKDGKNIIKGKVGNTTSTFHPDAGTGGTSGDWRVAYDSGSNSNNETWATVIGANGNLVDSESVTSTTAPASRGSTIFEKWRALWVIHTGFDTSALPDGDTIDSATYSVMPKQALTSADGSLNVVSSNPTSNTSGTVSDYQARGSTRFSTDHSVSDDVNDSYTDWSLNASGLAHITKTSISNFILTMAEDIDGTSPTWSSGETYGWNNVYMADETGTTKDPKLVVVHSVSVMGKSFAQII